MGITVGVVDDGKERKSCNNCICNLSISLCVGLDHTHNDLTENYVSNVI